ncbi:MAG: toll/interleukin-1 receptor domain-containing protein [Anaerolineales bacterium]|nr:toll/interleukin-1 receptor domain-containing protein [Anaerolineales bacterium]
MAAENEDRGAIAPASNTVAKSGSAAPTKPAAMPTRTIPATTTPDTDPTPDSQPPKVFISYLWDGEAHQRWVRDLATQLRADGVDAILNQSHPVPGDQLPAFMA